MARDTDESSGEPPSARQSSERAASEGVASEERSDDERTTDHQSEDRSVVRPSDALRHESQSNSPRRWLREAELWLFVDAHRWLVVGLLAAFVFAAVTLGVLLAPPSVMEYLLGGTALAKGYVELQTIDVTVITIVLSINQLVLSPELGAVGEQRSRLEEALENRTKTEELADVPTTPTGPDEYLRTVVEATRKRAEHLREAVAESDDEALVRHADEFTEDVVRESERVSRALEGNPFGTIEMLGAAMHFTTAEKIRTARGLRDRHAESLSDAEEEAFEDLLDVLELYTVTREYFRALYVQWEFVNFSRAILYLGLPALIIAHLTIGFVDANAFPGTVFGLPTLFVYESVAFTIILLPVLVVISYAARLSMLAKAGIFVSPFSPERKRGHWEE